MVQYRGQCGIPATNVYFFAVPDTDGHVNGWVAMDNVTKGADVTEPQLIHYTRLRKYVATVTQVQSVINTLPCSFIDVSVFFGLLA